MRGIQIDSGILGTVYFFLGTVDIFLGTVDIIWARSTYILCCQGIFLGTVDIAGRRAEAGIHLGDTIPGVEAALFLRVRAGRLQDGVGWGRGGEGERTNLITNII